MPSDKFLPTKRYIHLALILSLTLTYACSPGMRLLNRIPVNSISVEVVDMKGNPIKGAQVEASNGRSTTTNDKGIAEIRFGSVGVHYIGVYADHHMPTNFVVTMPTDNGEMIQTRLTDQIEFTYFSYGSVNLYPLMFNYLFSSFGYGFELDDFREGEWTTWAISTGNEETMRLSKAFLKRLENGQEWWQIKMIGDDGTVTYITEVLFSEDQGSILRLREKYGDGEVQEKPASEGWYTKPVPLTEESRDAALVEENVSVTIPKGTFEANRLKFDLSEEMDLNIWAAQDENIPGGVLQYKMIAGEEVIYESVLVDYGNDAETVLNSY